MLEAMIRAAADISPEAVFAVTSTTATSRPATSGIESVSTPR
jgi:hypothetical protein